MDFNNYRIIFGVPTPPKSNTVIHYHALIHRALKYAVKTDQLSVNPADKVDRPRKNGFQPAFYDKDEINQLLACVKGTLIETPVMLAAFYGLRRSEAVGLRWNAIDFQQNTITIQHTVIACRLNGKYEVIARDTTKTKSSRRTLPLAAPIRKYLLDLRVRQAENRRLCGNCYQSWKLAENQVLNWKLAYPENVQKSSVSGLRKGGRQAEAKARKM